MATRNKKTEVVENNSEILSFSQKIIRKTIEATSSIEEFLINEWYLSKDFIEQINKIEEKAKSFPWNVSSIYEMKKLRDEYVEYSVYTSLQHTQKNMLKTIIKEVYSNTWLKYKTEELRMSDGTEVMKTDSFVNQEVNTKMFELNEIEAYISDLEIRLKGVTEALKNIMILINSKMKHYEAEEIAIGQYSGDFWV